VRGISDPVVAGLVEAVQVGVDLAGDRGGRAAAAHDAADVVTEAVSGSLRLGERVVLLEEEGDELGLGVAASLVAEASVDGLHVREGGDSLVTGGGVGVSGLVHDVLLEAVGLGLFPCRWFKYGTRLGGVQPLDEKVSDES
jgi:hypothetical protein